MCVLFLLRGPDFVNVIVVVEAKTDECVLGPGYTWAFGVF